MRPRAQCNDRRQDLNPRGVVAGRDWRSFGFRPRCSAPVRACRGHPRTRLRCSSGHRPPAIFRCYSRQSDADCAWRGMPNRSSSMQAKSIRHMMRSSCMCCQKSFRNRIKCVQNCKRALNLSTIGSRAKLVSAARRSQGEGFFQPV